jgi:hypothetical protein
MITQIRTLLSTIATELEIPVLRKEQSVKKPVYPYMAWKILSVNGTDYSIRETKPIADETKILYEHFKVQTAIVSLSFYHTESKKTDEMNPLDVCYNLANASMDYISILGREQIRTLGIVCENISQSVSDRTTYLDPIYEYQVGFDFRVKAVKTVEQTVGAVNMDETLDRMELIIDNG